MTFYEWIRQCLLWDALRKSLPEEQKAAARERVRAFAAAQAEGNGCRASPRPEDGPRR